ncbi:EpsG family protein [Vibrio europaeus]|uniref:EpsG family protein n=1 Tax=Vibrio europaeus TaxID=300876 RepID=A0A178J7M1_9VIBR|nr:EpsG family protein [Vibrio europaeus]MDC5705014.1 EpsG family protein [Vibrio europaeus]MDC5710293.1 EpsG family protein [Vibrio europaeus]MDC5715383.1 EpsG family protein [Vibrio europaeus]MDC5719544.1 EpsG family protein [Vibrio europaeus]MDC5724568.1 EpsG family protein [Vibrio europaeus]
MNHLTIKTNIADDSKAYRALFLVGVSLLFALPAPFYIGLLVLILYLRYENRDWLYLFFISFVLLFSNMNLFKEIWAFGDFLGIGNDLGWYSTQWFSFNDHPYGYMSIFDDDYLIFINDGFLVKPKISEPIYHSYSYFFSRITDGNYIFYVYSLTFFIYLPACVVIFKILDANELDKVLIVLVMTFFLFFSMTFTNMFNMIRHYCSGSFLIITLFYLYFDRVKMACVFGVLACLTHNAAVVICAVYFITYVVSLRTDLSVRLKALAVIVGVSLLSIAYLVVYFYTFTNYEVLDDRGSGLAFKMLDILIFCLSFITFLKTEPSKFDKLWLFYVGVIVLILFMHLTNFLQLRYFAYFDYFRWIGVVYLFNAIISFRKTKLLFSSIMVVFFLFFLWLRIYISDFDFDGLFHDYFIVRYN